MPKVLFVATVVKTHIMEFHIPYLKLFQDRGWETAVAARNDYEDPSDCVIPYCDNYYDIPFERNPLNSNNLEAYRMLKKLIDNGKFDIIHCHTPVGGMLGRYAAKNARKKGTRVIYTAHGFHFYNGAPKKNWLLYYPAERVMAKYTDALITINREDYERAKKLHAKEIFYVPGVGINTLKYKDEHDSELKKIKRAKLRKELSVEMDAFLVLSVGELIPRKNHESLLRAIALLKEKSYYTRLDLVICGRGVLLEELICLSEKLGVADKVHFLGYRTDVNQICQASDLFAFASFQEGLPVALIEAMATGLPVVCSNIRGNCDLMEDAKECLVSPYNYHQIATAIDEMICNPDKMKKQGEINRLKAKQYDIDEVMKLYKQIYFGRELD